MKVRRAAEAELPVLKDLFWGHINAHPEYISHGEMQMGVGEADFSSGAMVARPAAGGEQYWMKYIKDKYESADAQVLVAEITDAANPDAAGSGTADSDEAGSGAADPDAADSGTVDSDAADLDVAGSGAADSDEADSGATDSDEAGSGAADPDAADSGTVDSGMAVLAGFCVVEITDDGAAPFGVVCDILVREDVRGGGIGGALLEAAFAWLRSRGIQDVYLESGKDNSPAHDFFRRRGFVHISEIFRLSPGL